MTTCASKLTGYNFCSIFCALAAHQYENVTNLKPTDPKTSCT